MRSHLLPVLAVLAAGAAAVAVTQTVPPAEVPRYSKIAASMESRVACQPVGDGALMARGSGPVIATVHGEEAGEPVDHVTMDVTGLVSVRGIVPSGGVLTDVWAPCQPPGASGVVVFLDAASAELRLTNADAAPAIVDLTLLGADGEILALGSSGIQLAPGESRPIAVSVLAKDVEGPVAVGWRTTKGRVVAAGVTTGTVRYVAGSSTAATTQTLVGQGQGGKPVVVLANTGTERATATVDFHGTSSTFTPDGGQDISIPARSVVAVDLTAGTAGDPGAFTVESDEPIVATLYSGTGEVRGTSEATMPDQTLSGVVPGGSSLQLTNLGDAQAIVAAALGDTVEDTLVEPGATLVLPVAGDGPVTVQIEANQPLVGAAVTAEGKAVVPLSPLAAAQVEPLDAELVPTLR